MRYSYLSSCYFSCAADCLLLGYAFLACCWFLLVLACYQYFCVYGCNSTAAGVRLNCQCKAMGV